MRATNRSDYAQLSPWDIQQDETGATENILLRFTHNREKKKKEGTFRRSQRVKQTPDFAQMVEKKKQAIMKKLQRRQRRQVQPPQTTNLPLEEIKSQQLQLASMFPSYSLKHMNKSRTFYRPRRYMDHANPQQENASNHHKKKENYQDLIKTNKSFTFEEPQQRRRAFLQSEIRKSLTIPNRQRVPTANMVMIAMNKTLVERTNKRLSELLQSIKEKEKQKAASRIKTEQIVAHSHDCYRSKKVPFIALPKIQIIELQSQTN